MGAECPVSASHSSSSFTSEGEHLHGDVQRVWPAVRWLQKSRGGPHPAGHMLFPWRHSSLVSPSRAERALRARLEQRHRPACVRTRPSRKAIGYAGQHGQAAWTRSCCLRSHRAREAHGEKRKVSVVPRGASTCCQRADQQPDAEAAAAAALCSAGALGSARAWSDRKQKERVDKGGVS